MNTRRQFLIKAPLGLLGAAAACSGDFDDSSSQTQDPTPGAPPAFNTAKGAGPKVSAQTFEQAEKLVEVTMTGAERDMAAKAWRTSMAPLMERRVGPRKVEIGDSVAPATTWNPILPGLPGGPEHDRFVRSSADPGRVPKSDADIAFAPVTHLSRWIERRELTSTRLTQIYLDRIAKHDGRLRAIITASRTA
jgi:hypothetical protein